LPASSDTMARRYLGKFYACERIANLITGKAESIGMNPRHLSAVKSAEQRDHLFNELGAIKLACLWMLDHIDKK
jgi:hypothetical protein